MSKSPPTATSVLRSVSPPPITQTQKPSRPLSNSFSTLTDNRPSLNKALSDSAISTQENDPPTDGSPRDEAADLNSEVNTLSNKLISAINHQTKLDDSLSATKHELELSRVRIRQLEAEAQERADMLAKGLLLEKKNVDLEKQKLQEKLDEEVMQRGQAEKDKRNIEQELENLTTALFDEANKMVSAARRERDALDRKNEQLRAQLADTETLLASHQEQLAELKAVMQQMTTEREEAESKVSAPATPSTAVLATRTSKESLARVFDGYHFTPNVANAEEFPPCPPTSLTNFLTPVLRDDITAYQDFLDVLFNPAKDLVAPTGRNSGGSFTSIQAMGIMGLSMGSPGTSPGGIGSSLFGRRKADPSSAGHSPSGSIIEAPPTVQQLKESKFYKRVLLEDIDPTLRLECAPGLSWLARRSVQNAITEGSLVIDPMPAGPRVNMFSCALCGENRPDEAHARSHRMRINENQTAQRYPLCGYCVNRLRCVCDFLAFLRTLKEGLWKIETEADQKHAWEESVKLRERMFWARIGGGVVPAFMLRDPAARTQSETPPRTPVKDADMLEIPRRKSGPIEPFLTPEKRDDHASLSPSPLVLSSGQSDISVDTFADAVEEEREQVAPTPEPTNNGVEMNAEAKDVLPEQVLPEKVLPEEVQPAKTNAQRPYSVPHAKAVPGKDSKHRPMSLKLDSGSHPAVIPFKDIPQPPSPTHNIPGGW